MSTTYTYTHERSPERLSTPTQPPCPGMEATQQTTTQNVADLLMDAGRELATTSATLDVQQLSDTTCMPNSFVDDNGKIIYTTAIKRNPSQYEHVFKEAERLALHQQLHYAITSTEDLQHVHIRAIQQAICTQVGSGQETAENHLDDLTHQATEAGNPIIDTQQIKDQKAEVCTMKSLIAAHYLHDHLPDNQRTITTTAEKSGEEGHAYLTFVNDGVSHEFHPNSPTQTTDYGWEPMII